MKPYSEDDKDLDKRTDHSWLLCGLRGISEKHLGSLIIKSSSVYQSGFSVLRQPSSPMADSKEPLFSGSWFCGLAVD